MDKPPSCFVAGIPTGAYQWRGTSLEVKMPKLSIVLLISAGTATFWSLMSLLFHFSGICTGIVAVITFIGAFAGLSVCMVSEN